MSAPAPLSEMRAEGGSPWPVVEVAGVHARARREWLVTNGAGAYASSTIATTHTRRYHGLLVAALDPPRRRHVLVSHVDVSIVASAHDGGRPRTHELSMHQFPGVDPETKPLALAAFAMDPLPRWRWEAAGGELEVALALVRGTNAVVLRYAWRGPAPVTLKLRPLLAMRPFHALARENGGMVQRVELRAGEVRVKPSRELPRVCFRHEGTFVGSPDWWRRFEYLAEQRRGLEFHEDLWTPGVFERALMSGDTAWLVAAADELPVASPAELFDDAAARRLAMDPGPAASPIERRLAVAAGAFRADDAAKPTVMAGYPWFESFGRHTLASLPGLYLVPAAHDDAVAVLRGVIASMQGGLVPKRLPDEGGPPDLHAADATLWLFEAARLVAKSIGERHAFVTDELLLALRDAFEAVHRGGRTLRLTADGLVAAGDGSDALTWMDARVAGVPVTPRSPCPIELSALWSKGCETLARLARAAGDAPLEERATAACRRARAAIAERFWCDATHYPFDVVSEGNGSSDPAIRPNAVLALSIDPDAFGPDRASAIVSRARRELLTPCGLRTLARGEAGYRGRLGGDVAARDAALHQGTVWPTLIGAFVRAALRVEGAAAIPELLRLVETAADNALAIGQVAEVASGDPPHEPDGCVAHAWSVAELWRAVAWDLKPREAARPTDGGLRAPHARRAGLDDEEAA